jgi:hypothetical protein
MAPHDVFCASPSSTLYVVPPSTPDQAVVLAIDPGLRVGYAYLNAEGACLLKGIESAEAVGARLQGHSLPIAVGGGTERHAILGRAAALGVGVTVVNEEGTSLEGRELWRNIHGRRGLRRVLPRGILLPPGPIDDYAAWAIGLRYLGIGLKDVPLVELA